jgi:mannose-6-phosphate isomerase-like protein (cupin superfamily)
MTDGQVLLPGAGNRIQTAGMTLKVGAAQTPRWSAFEAEVWPGFDVGAHVHGAAEEIFYILEGELELLAFEPAELGELISTANPPDQHAIAALRARYDIQQLTPLVPAAGPHPSR